MAVAGHKFDTFYPVTSALIVKRQKIGRAAATLLVHHDTGGNEIALKVESDADEVKLIEIERVENGKSLLHLEFFPERVTAGKGEFQLQSSTLNSIVPVDYIVIPDQAEYKHDDTQEAL